MRWCISEIVRLISIILLIVVYGSFDACAQTKYEQRLERYKRGWNRLIPRYGKIQYAGGMGLISLGVGWDYGKKKQWETDFFLGYLPRFDGDKGHLTITLKENYIPWQVKIKSERWLLEPFTASFYINKIFGDEFWTRLPSKYPDKYYWRATRWCFNLAFGQRLRFKIKPIGLSNHLTIFYELGTNDIYVISYFTNKYLKLTDTFNLSVGIKFQFL